MPHTWVDDDDALARLVARLRDEPAYGLDTEFHRERTYWPRVGLVQLSWPDGVALVDPLAVDLTALADLLDGPGTMVTHAADQDLEILERSCGRGPRALFDTQIAAGFCGLGSPSLGALVERVLHIRLAKARRLTDWTRRPLAPDDLDYAADDVACLLDLHRELVTRAEAAGRLDWVRDECEERLHRDRSPQDPDTAWWRLKGAGSLRGRARGVAQTVAAWRERRARELDRPPRTVLPDLALLGVVHRPPRTREELAAVRGLEGRRLRDDVARELLEAVTAGLGLPEAELRLPAGERLDRALAPAVTLLAAWTGQRAAELGLDAALLATRADLEALLRGDPDARAARGWRRELVAEPARRLLAGELVVALEAGGHRLVLEERSGPAEREAPPEPPGTPPDAP